jgi:hypothetical protein
MTLIFRRVSDEAQAPLGCEVVDRAEVGAHLARQLADHGAEPSIDWKHPVCAVKITR